MMVSKIDEVAVELAALTLKLFSVTSLADRISQAITTAVAEAEAVAHATGRLNMELAVETERERCAKMAESMYQKGQIGSDIAAAIRKGGKG